MTYSTQKRVLVLVLLEYILALRVWLPFVLHRRLLKKSFLDNYGIVHNSITHTNTYVSNVVSVQYDT